MRSNKFVATAATAQGLHPAHPKVSLAVRQALKDHVSTVLFQKTNAQGEAFRAAQLKDRTETQQKALQQDLLAEAGRWTPAKDKWTRTVSGEVTTYAGRFHGWPARIEVGANHAVTAIHLDL
jgi:hypothetical protein